MRADLSAIACVIDRSGSMGSIADDAIGGFNTFLAAQQAGPGAALMTLVLFDHEYQRPHDLAPIQSVRPLDRTTYVPRGSTALLDAVGRTIDGLGRRLAAMDEAERPGQVIVAILTDGMENASQRYTYEQVAARIAHQRSVYDWQFVFLAANQDAIAAAGHLAIEPQDAIAFESTDTGVREAYQAMSAAVTARRMPRA